MCCCRCEYRHLLQHADVIAFRVSYLTDSAICEVLPDEFCYSLELESCAQKRKTKEGTKAYVPPSTSHFECPATLFEAKKFEVDLWHLFWTRKYSMCPSDFFLARNVLAMAKKPNFRSLFRRIRFFIDFQASLVLRSRNIIPAITKNSGAFPTLLVTTRRISVVPDTLWCGVGLSSTFQNFCAPLSHENLVASACLHNFHNFQYTR